MSQSKKIIVIAALSGAVFGAMLARNRIPALASDGALLAHRPLLIAAVLLWVIFGFYWEAVSKKASPAKSSESESSRTVHVVLVNAALLLEVMPIRGLGRFEPASASLMAAGLAVEVLGLFLAVWARRHLGRNWSGEISIKVDHQLIRSGPYGWLRHPIYTGLLAMYVGLALVTGERLALIGLAMVSFAYWRKIRLEEANLRVAFGADYDAYRRESWALVPGVF